MFLLLQFPFADFRSFLVVPTNQVPLPTWPVAEPGRDFVRSFGGVVRRRLGGLDDWAGEEIFSGAERALRFVPALGSQRIGPPRAMRSPVCLFRRIFVTGGPACRVELGFRPRSCSQPWCLSRWETPRLIESVLTLRILLQSGANKVPKELGAAGRQIASLFLSSTTSTSDGQTLPHQHWWATSRPPMLLIEYKSSEIREIPRFVRRVGELGSGISIFHGWFDWQGIGFSVWMIRNGDQNSTDALRKLRLHIFRLHTERECLIEVLRLIDANKVPVVPGTKQFRALELYLEGALHQLLEDKSHGLTRSDMFRSAQDLENVAFLGGKTSVLSQLTKIRHNIRLQIERFASPADHRNNGGYSVDPISVITLISSGLKLVDQFRELAVRFRKQVPTPPSERAEQVGTALEVRQGDRVTQRIEAKDLRLDHWDGVRYDALSKRIRTNWDIYNDLFSNEAGASVQEGARIRADMRKLQESLCQDFKEMVHLYEHALGIALPDHYQLYEVCQGGN